MKKTIILLLVLFKITAGFSQLFTFNGSATYNGGECYTVCPDLLNSVGSMWKNTQINLTQPFVYDFSLNFGTKDANGADGIALVIQQVGLNALGAQGMGIGYTGLNMSLCIEFDTYQNSPFDPVADHIGVQTNGIGNHQTVANTLTAAVSLPANIEDGMPHPVKVTWDPTYDSLKVYFDCILRVAIQYNIVQNIFSGNPLAWWGFTSATGGSSNTHVVCFVDTLQARAGNDILACQPVQLNGIVTGVQPITYSWAPALGLSNPNILNPVANPATPTNYVLSVSDGCGFVARDTIKVTVVNMTANAGTDRTICSGDTVVLHGSGGISYSWTPAASLVTSNIQNPNTLPLLNTTTFTVMVFDTNACSASDNVLITVNPLPEIQAMGSTICYGDTGTVTAISDVNNTSFIWYPGADTTNPASFSPNATTIYTVIGDRYGCKDTTSTTITVNPLPFITINSPSICLGGDAVLSASGATSYVWNDGSTFNPYTVSPFQTTTYSITGTDANGCSDTTSTLVTINPNPTVIANPAYMCEGDSATITATGAISYVWNTGDTSPSITVNPSTTTVYTVTGSNSFGCVGTDTANALVYPTPIIDFIANPWAEQIDNPIIFTGSANVPVVLWQWSFGDGFTDNSGDVVTHTYANDGTFHVTLNITSDHSCLSTITHDVIIELDMQFPNVFTPNSDGTNDTFEIVGLKPDKENKLQVFNRWGKKIYEKERYDNSWTGEGAADGTYYYIFSWKSYTQGKELSYSNTVTIIRQSLN